MADDEFYDEKSDRSRVKSTIVDKYFDAWSRVMVGQAKRFPHKDQRIAYIDLFCGPGRFKDGTESTPLLIVRRAAADPDLASRLVMLLNDRNPDFATQLQQELAQMPELQALKHPPVVTNEEVGESSTAFFKSTNLVPSLIFVDPWGYAGLTLELLAWLTKDWGCDLLFFFNYNRINAALTNPKVECNMIGLFGEDGLYELRTAIDGLDPGAREAAVVEQLLNKMERVGIRYILPFRFADENGTRTSHHIVFGTKHALGYKIMKEIMAKESSSRAQGVASLEYNPADSRNPRLFELARPLDDLNDMLTSSFEGKSLTVKDIFDEHNVGRPFILANFKSSLKELEAAGRVSIDPEASRRRKGTLRDDAVVTFPSLEDV